MYCLLNLELLESTLGNVVVDTGNEMKYQSQR